MNTESLSTKLLRIALGVVVLWIGALKFTDPEGVVALLQASLPFLAFPAFAYLLGVVEVLTALWLFSGKALKWAGLFLAGLFAGTLTIFLIAPAVSYGDKGFPFLSLAGEFLLKDLVLIAVALSFFLGDRRAVKA